MSELFDMGGYGQYVWSSYGICAVVLGVLVAGSIMGRNRKRRELETMEGSRRRRRNRQQDTQGEHAV